MSINRVVTITIGGIVYNAKATIGLYATACEAAGVDITALFSGTMPSSKLVKAFAQGVTGMTEAELNEAMLIEEYADVVHAMMVCTYPEELNTETTVDDAQKN